jgi:hypothetical protein
MLPGALFTSARQYMERREKAESQNWKTLARHRGKRYFHKAVSVICLTLLTIGFTGRVFAQGEPVPFDVLNP